MPEGYELVERNLLVKSVKTYWKDLQNQEIFLRQFCINNFGTVDTENTNCIVFYTENLKILCFEKHDYKEYIWNNDEYYFSLSIPYDIKDEQHIHIIESIIPIK